jgi:hypothetical protein
VNPAIIVQGQKQDEYCIVAMTVPAHTTVDKIVHSIVPSTKKVHIVVDWKGENRRGTTDTGNVLTIGVNTKFKDLVGQSVDSWRLQNANNFRSVHILDCPWEPEAQFCDSIFVAPDGSSCGTFLRYFQKENSNGNQVFVKMFGFCVKKKTIQMKKMQQTFESHFTLDEDIGSTDENDEDMN